MLDSGVVKVGSYVSIKDGCPISYHVLGSGVCTEFYCGQQMQGFEFVIEPEALREFIRAATDALRDMDERAAAG